MCKFCDETQNIISEETAVKNLTVFVDLRYDAGNHMLEIQYGAAETNIAEWTKSFEIKFCPICGVKLNHYRRVKTCQNMQYSYRVKTD